MIIVVEEISAAGKTTWCNQHDKSSLVSDDRHLQPPAGRPTAQYWTDWNVKRWREAVETEGIHGLAICDTDPLKLHYCWGLWQIGEGSKNQYLLQLEATRTATSNNLLGFADLYLVKKFSPTDARRQRDNDVQRPRDRFEIHLQLQQPLIAWYTALQTVLGERVIWGFPKKLPLAAPTRTVDRFRLDAFDNFVSLLPDTQENI